MLSRIGVDRDAKRRRVVHPPQFPNAQIPQLTNYMPQLTNGPQPETLVRTVPFSAPLAVWALTVIRCLLAAIPTLPSTLTHTRLLPSAL